MRCCVCYKAVHPFWATTFRVLLMGHIAYVHQRCMKGLPIGAVIEDGYVVRDER